MKQTFDNEQGSAMVLAIGVLAVLAVLAVVIVAMVSSEKKTAQAEYAQDRSFYSADAASEGGVNWIHNQYSPAALVDSLNNVYVNNTYSHLTNNSQYLYNIQYVGKQYRAGWSSEYKDYVYRISAQGASAQQSQAAVTVDATRLYREGY
jgi:Tfp pilus assembly protein PilX